MLSREKGLSQVTTWPNQHQVLRGWSSNPGITGPGLSPSHTSTSQGPGLPGRWLGCLLSRQRHCSDGLFPDCDTEHGLFLGGPNTASIVCIEVLGAGLHHTCHLSSHPAWHYFPDIITQVPRQDCLTRGLIPTVGTTGQFEVGSSSAPSHLPMATSD